MELYTYTRSYKKDQTIDSYISAIWTERYKGDGDFELSVEASSDMLAKLPKGQLMLCEGSNEPMILETRDIKNGILKVTGIALPQWLNNRIVRYTAVHKDKEYTILAVEPGVCMYVMAQQFAMESNFSTGVTPIGIPVPITSQFPIPGLGGGSVDTTGPAIDITVPYGQLYNNLKSLADTYEIGMRIILADSGVYPILFETYRGVDRTSAQTDNPLVQFSKDMDSFTDIHDLESIEQSKTLSLIFGSGHSDLAGVTVGQASPPSGMSTGFDLKVIQNWADDITADQDGGDVDQLNSLLTQRAQTELKLYKPVQLVDGQIVQVEGVVYGDNFFMGDLVEVIGNTGTLQTARVTEYIRSKDAAGEKAYPGLTFIDE